MKIDRIRVLVGTTLVLLAWGAFAHAKGRETIPYDVTNMLTRVSQEATAPTKGTTVDLTNLQNPPAPLPTPKPKRMIKKKVTPRPAPKNAPALTEQTRYIVVDGKAIPLRTHVIAKGERVSLYAKNYKDAGGVVLKHDAVYLNKVLEVNPQLKNGNKIIAGRTINLPVFDPEVGEPTLTEAVGAIKKAKTLEQKGAAVEQEKVALKQELEKERTAHQEAKDENGRLAGENQDLKDANETAEQEKISLGTEIERLKGQIAEQLKTNARFSESIAKLTARLEKTQP